jgi:MYXO-CTERM domain-containing protein
MLSVVLAPPAAAAAPGAQVTVEVIDLLTRRPLRGAQVAIVGSDGQRAITDSAGLVRLGRPAQTPRFAVGAVAKGYLGTTETLLPTRTTRRVVIALPPLDRLQQADALIRSAATLDPQRQQRRVETPELRAKPQPIAGGLTYPLPKTIDVKKTDGSIITLELEEYLKGVLPKEIGTSFPAEAQKAQAVAARTYTISYTKGGTKAICTTTACQVWSSTHYASTDQAVEDTKGQVAVYTGSDTAYKDKLAGGYFAASCGGATVNSEDGGWNFRPFLRGVTCIENKTGSCSAICQPSTCGNARCPSSHPTCWGIFGHRIGLCQRGAQAMAKCNKTHLEIVRHYYADTEIANVGSDCVDADGDSYVTAGPNCPPPYDCDDTNKEIHPGATEICGNNVDEDCHDGDLPCSPTCVDNDGDGHFAAGAGCKEPFDCDDTDKAVYPGAPEFCDNNTDDDCDGKTDEGCALERKLGELCQVGADCLSALCVDHKGKRICSQPCSGSQPCPAGYSCDAQGVCLPTESGSGGNAEGGCSTAAQSSGPLLPSLLLLGLFVALISRRRRHHR